MQETLEMWRLRGHPPPQGGASLLPRAIAGVMRNAQQGELPLFAWTLGLSQPQLLRMFECCFPEVGMLEPMPRRAYAVLADTVPQTFGQLVDLLLAHREPSADPAYCDWLARAVAAACFGDRHLWEDLGLDGRNAVSCLLEQYFRPLYLRNTQDLRWKRFLFAELGAAHGKTDYHPPGCSRCDQQARCFQDTAQGAMASDGSGQQRD